MAPEFSTVDDYVNALPPEVRAILEEIRRSIRQAVPGAEETIKYQMPTITLNGKSIVHVAAWKHHIGLYPLPELDDALTREVAPYATGKGTARFPLDEPVPYALIGRLARLLADRQR